MFLIFINFAAEKHLNPLTSINMAKKVFMIAPFDALTGNLSGDQVLQYAENNNPAYEAPNGTQYARNYRTRYVGARRGKDGLVYFQVKQSTATVLTASSRRAMAIIGVTAAIRSSLMRSHASDWRKINQAFEYLKAHEILPEGQDTFNKWFSAQIKDMLVYKRTSWSFTQASISFTIHNPYDLNSSEALGIKQSTWVKFATIFLIPATAGNVILMLSVDGKAIVAQGASGFTWNTLVSAISTQLNANYKLNLTGLSLTDDAVPNVLYNDMQLYYNDVEVAASAAVVADAKYTTAAPIEP